MGKWKKKKRSEMDPGYRAFGTELPGSWFHNRKEVADTSSLPPPTGIRALGLAIIISALYDISHPNSKTCGGEVNPDTARRFLNGNIGDITFWLDCLVFTNQEKEAIIKKLKTF